MVERARFDQKTTHTGAFERPDNRKKASLGDFEVLWDDKVGLTVVWSEQTRWELPADFLEARHTDTQVRESRGFFKFNEKHHQVWSQVKVSALSRQGDRIVLEGCFNEPGHPAWSATFELLEKRQLGFRFSCQAPRVNRLVLWRRMAPDEKARHGLPIHPLNERPSCPRVVARAWHWARAPAAYLVFGNVFRGGRRANAVQRTFRSLCDEPLPVLMPREQRDVRFRFSIQT